LIFSFYFYSLSLNTMLSKCCYCIGLRAATLFLASLGTLAYLSNSYHLSILAGKFGFFYSVLSTYYLGATFACIAGITGVLKNNAKYVRIYAMFYWWQLMLGFTVSIVFSVVAFYFNKDVCEQLIDNLMLIWIWRLVWIGILRPLLQWWLCLQ